MAPLVLLQTRGLTRHFGGVKAVDCIDFALQRGQVHALIGPNGAGKTTFVSLLCGRISAQSGSISFDGLDISQMPAHARVAVGIAYTFQITSIYADLSAFDNVALAVQNHGTVNLHERTMAALLRVGLKDQAFQAAGTLSYGHQRLLEICMGLALQPKLLILDEPTQGLAEAEIEGFKTLIQSLSKTTTVLLIEHNMEVVMSLADRITVLNFGTILAEGSVAEIKANVAVQAAYLGTEYAAD
jgi:branched-chain amino acid transport system ATP-binding protein